MQQRLIQLVDDTVFETNLGIKIAWQNVVVILIKIDSIDSNDKILIDFWFFEILFTIFMKKRMNELTRIYDRFVDSYIFFIFILHISSNNIMYTPYLWGTEFDRIVLFCSHSYISSDYLHTLYCK